MDNEPISFDAPGLAEAVERASAAQVNDLPFGAIRLDAAGRVVFYSDAERRLSGYRKAAVGQSFFTSIAPCMNNASFRGRIERALQRGKLDIAFDHVGDFDDEDREVRVRVQSAAGGGCWIFMQREG